MSTKVGRSPQAEMLIEIIGRYIHLLANYFNVVLWSFFEVSITGFLLMFTGEWSSIPKIQKENNCQEGKVNFDAVH